MRNLWNKLNYVQKWAVIGFAVLAVMVIGWYGGYFSK